jgi:DNA-binding GntR family transcriptional regulator
MEMRTPIYSNLCIQTARTSSARRFSAERAAYEYLLGEIFAGRLQGGCSIRQEEIAERLSLSRIPVRDAIRHLVGEGFLTLESNRRVTVTLLEA